MIPIAPFDRGGVFMRTEVACSLAQESANVSVRKDILVDQGLQQRNENSACHIPDFKFAALSVHAHLPLR